MRLAEVIPMKLGLDNVNQMLEVRDGSSIRQSFIDNSIEGFLCLIRGVPLGMRIMPKA